MAETYDIAIIGAGHNGLVAANYLARAGCKVGVFEARDVVGGACVTEELIPGARFSSCAFVQGLFRDEIVSELELKKHGLEMYAPDVQGFALFDDGSSLFLWKELDRTLREIERYSKADAERFIEFGTRYRRFGEIMKPFMFDAPPARSEVFAAFEAAGAEDLFDEFVLNSTNDLLDRYFENEHIKGFLTFYGMVSIWGGPSTPGLAYVYGHHASGEFEGQLSRWAFVRGGMGGITRALAAGARAHGATIRTGAPVARLAIKSGQARGLLLASGEEIEADIVVSNAEPKRSLLRFVEPSELDSSFREAVENIDQRGAMARVHLLVDRASPLRRAVGRDARPTAPGPPDARRLRQELRNRVGGPARGAHSRRLPGRGDHTIGHRPDARAEGSAHADAGRAAHAERACRGHVGRHQGGVGRPRGRHLLPLRAQHPRPHRRPPRHHAARSGPRIRDSGRLYLPHRDDDPASSSARGRWRRSAAIARPSRDTISAAPACIRAVGSWACPATMRPRRC